VRISATSDVSMMSVNRGKELMSIRLDTFVAELAELPDKYISLDELMLRAVRASVTYSDVSRKIQSSAQERGRCVTRRRGPVSMRRDCSPGEHCCILAENLSPSPRRSLSPKRHRCERYGNDNSASRLDRPLEDIHIDEYSTEDSDSDDGCNGDSLSYPHVSKEELDAELDAIADFIRYYNVK
jgi:hypothetical protein